MEGKPTQSKRHPLFLCYKLLVPENVLSSSKYAVFECASCVFLYICSFTHAQKDLHLIFTADLITGRCVFGV